MLKENDFEQLASNVMDDIRNDCLSPEVALSMTNYPMNDYLRSKLGDTDLNHVLRLMQKEDSRLKGLGVMICRPFQHEPAVKQRLVSIWESEGRQSLPLGFGCIYRLLEYEDITNDLKYEFFNFIKENWAAWRSKLVSCYDEHFDIIQVSNSRIRDPDFPAWKNWIYLVEMACSADSYRAQVTIRDQELGSTESDNADFMETVKKWVLKNAF